MALDMRETTQLVTVLQMSDKPLQAILEALKGFSRQESCGRLCIALRCMYMDSYYHSSDADYNSEILITCFILHSFSVGQSSGRPPPNTKSVLYQLLQHTEHSIREKESKQDFEGFREKVALKVFILQCLAGRQELLTKTPKQLLGDSLMDLLQVHTSLQNDPHLAESLRDAKQAYDDENSTDYSGAISGGVTPLLVPNDSYNVDTGYTNETFHSKEVPALDIRFDPICDRPSPPPLGVGEQELGWLYTEGLTTDLIWDTTMSNTPDEALELRDRVQKALRQNLANEEQLALKLKLTQNPDALLRVGVTPARFPTLVERNSTVASHFITTLVQTNLRTAEEFLTSLVHMNPCLGSCSVMSELVKVPTFPISYATSFIVNAISFVKSNRNASDTRRVGIVCTFCLGLARETDPASPKSRILSVDLVAQLTQFAVENASVSEASTLFKTLKERAEKESGEQDS